ncbi:MAG: hypothetical protein WC899_10625 [bacterium]|jgi:hypothetical protein
MSDIVKRLTKLNRAQIREYDFSSAVSAKEGFVVPGVPARQNFRVYADKIQGPEDRRQRRLQEGDTTPLALRSPK